MNGKLIQSLLTVLGPVVSTWLTATFRLDADLGPELIAQLIGIIGGAGVGIYGAIAQYRARRALEDARDNRALADALTRADTAVAAQQPATTNSAKGGAAGPASRVAPFVLFGLLAASLCGCSHIALLPPDNADRLAAHPQFAAAAKNAPDFTRESLRTAAIQDHELARAASPGGVDYSHAHPDAAAATAAIRTPNP